MKKDNFIKKGINFYKKFGFRLSLLKLFEFIRFKYINLITLLKLDGIILPLLFYYKKTDYFYFNKKKLNYFFHKYNYCWRNERKIEVPIILDFLKKYEEKKVLEIGAVLKHYCNPNWNIIDKFEKGKGIINQDIEYFKPKVKYDLIISISTFEHIGFPDYGEKFDSRKILKSIVNIKKNCLQKKGIIVFSIPLGYNPNLDHLIENKKIKLYKRFVFKRYSLSNRWIEINKNNFKNCKYNEPFEGANYILIGVIKNN